MLLFLGTFGVDVFLFVGPLVGVGVIPGTLVCCVPAVDDAVAFIVIVVVDFGWCDCGLVVLMVSGVVFTVIMVGDVASFCTSCC